MDDLIKLCLKTAGEKAPKIEDMLNALATDIPDKTAEVFNDVFASGNAISSLVSVASAYKEAASFAAISSLNEDMANVLLDLYDLYEEGTYSPVKTASALLYNGYKTKSDQIIKNTLTGWAATDQAINLGLDLAKELCDEVLKDVLE